MNFVRMLQLAFGAMRKVGRQFSRDEAPFNGKASENTLSRPFFIEEPLFDLESGIGSPSLAPSAARPIILLGSVRVCGTPQSSISGRTRSSDCWVKYTL